MQQQDGAYIEAHSVGKSFEAHRVLDALTFQVERGQIVGLLGANGAGKTTLLRILLGQLPPDQGTVRLLGAPAQDLPAEVRARVGYVPQSSDLFGWLTGNAMLKYVGSFYPAWDEAIALSLAERLQLPLRSYVHQMSPGHQQRLSFVRAMASRPDLLLLDEPMAALDPAARLLVIDELRRAHAERGVTMVVSSHLIHDLERYCTHLAVVSQGRFAVFQPMEYFAGLLRVVVAGDENTLRMLPPGAALCSRKSGARELTLVLKATHLDALTRSLPTGVALREQSSDLEAVMSEWMH